MNDIILYENWLTIAAPIYIIFSILIMFLKVPKGAIYYNYRVAKIGFSILMLLMGLYIGSLVVFDYRVTNLALASTLNLVAYFAGARIISSIMKILLDAQSVTLKRMRMDVLRLFVLTLILILNYFFTPSNLKQIFIAVLSVLFVVELAVAVVSFFKVYKLVIAKGDNYYSDGVSAFIGWIKRSIYLIFACGVIGFMHSIYPPVVNVLYGAFSLIMFVYIYVSFQNYLVSLNKISYALSNQPEKENKPTSEQLDTLSTKPVNQRQDSILLNYLDKWVEKKGYTVAGITIEDVAIEVCSNRTYVSNLIREKYDLSYRDWIAELRINYSKELLVSQPDLRVTRVAEMVGYNRSSYTKAFTKLCGVTPTVWREKNIGS